MWTGENETKTISVDANLFENGAKQLRFRLKTDSCGQGLNLRPHTMQTNNYVCVSKFIPSYCRSSSRFTNGNYTKTVIRFRFKERWWIFSSIYISEYSQMFTSPSANNKWYNRTLSLNLFLFHFRALLHWKHVPGSTWRHSRKKNWDILSQGEPFTESASRNTTWL